MIADKERVQFGLREAATDDESTELDFCSSEFSDSDADDVVGPALRTNPDGLNTGSGMPGGDEDGQVDGVDAAYGNAAVDPVGGEARPREEGLEASGGEGIGSQSKEAVDESEREAALRARAPHTMEKRPYDVPTSGSFYFHDDRCADQPVSGR